MEIFVFTNRALRRIPIPASPMSGSDLSYYRRNSVRGKSILEFGYGGSTLLFANAGKSVTRVESDRYFSYQVLSNILTFKLQNRVCVFLGGYWSN